MERERMAVNQGQIFLHNYYLSIYYALYLLLNQSNQISFYFTNLSFYRYHLSIHLSLHRCTDLPIYPSISLVYYFKSNLLINPMTHIYFCFIYLAIYVTIKLSFLSLSLIYLSQSIHLFVFLPIYVSFSLPAYISINVSIYLYIYLPSSLTLSISLPIYLSTCLSVYLFTGYLRIK